MNLTAVLILALSLVATASGHGQNISLKLENAPLERLFTEVQKQSTYNFVYFKNDLRKAKTIDVKVENGTITEILEAAFKDQPLTYTIVENLIIIKRKPARDLIPPLILETKPPPVTGIVRGPDGQPLAGVNVSIKGTKRGVVTDAQGRFLIDGKADEVLVFTFIGYKDTEVALTASTLAAGQVLSISLVRNVTSIEQVVITGMFLRKKENFSGSSVSFTGQQLRDIGNQNVIQALRTLDPSFTVIDNALNGSNPNALASIELRGKTSINSKLNNFGVITDQLATDPNQPLFVLDGFESTLRQITDLDMNRIASITILKDAASTALYGSRSANGVIVVETIKPKAGALQISYAGNYTIEVADLSDYNLMNSEQKLEFERLAGRYNSEVGEMQLEMQRRYNQRLKAVREGVNTYWLNEPLRTGFTQKHAIYVNGGSNEFQFGAGVDYQDINGVMKGSGRKNWAGRVDLNYRTRKLNISNRVYVNGYRSNESLYGTFSDYARINPFYMKGYTERYFETRSTGSLQGLVIEAVNPLYNAVQNSYNYGKNISLLNYLQFNWDLDNTIRISGGLQLGKMLSSNVDFASPEHTRFDGQPILQKGNYTEINAEGMTYDANLMLSYNKVFGAKHVVTTNARADIRHEEGTSRGFTAVGFPAGVNGNPTFANSYQLNSKPIVSMPPTVRRVNILGSMNYVYDNRYFLDATYRLDGSTVFGSENRYSPFWSTGIGWRARNERFLSELGWLNTLTIRANIGSTGNQQLGSFSSTTVYNLEVNTNFFGQGLYHNSLGNPDLKWQKTLQSNLGLDFSMFKDKLSGTINIYNKRTDPLIVTIDLPGSNGVANYPINTGKLIVKGIEGSVRYSIINNIQSRTIWTAGLTGSAYKSTYGGFSNTLNSLNENQQKSQSIIRYRDGYSPDDIWVVPSIGIDPATGQELFLKQNGMYSFEYNPKDARVVASLRPKAEGVISSTLRIKGLTLGAYVRYRVGASVVNSALYEKVENVSLEDIAYNQDARALQSRWKKPGDIAQFKGIQLNTQTPISSRFVQKENVFSGESFSAGYEFQASTNRWLKKARLESLRFTGFMNNIFRLSNIRAERGINYPFANTVSFSMNASFN